MLDMKFVRENPDVVKENIKKKFQDEKLPLVDEVLELDAQNRAAMNEAALEGQKWDAEKAALEEQMAQQEQSLVAMSWFWQVDEAYTRGKKNLCRSLIAQMEEKELVESLPKENATGNSRFAPYDRFMEIKEAVG